MRPTVRYSPAIVRAPLLRILLVGGIPFIYGGTAFAQTQPPKSTEVVNKAPAASAPDYSKEASVIEQSRTSFKFENDGSGDEIQYARIRIQSPQALQAWGQLIFTYSAASDKVSVEFVRIHKPDGHVVTAGPDAVQDLNSPVERIAPMYTDIRQIHVTVPDLNVGDTLEYQIHTTTVRPLVPGQFFTQWNALKQVITLDETFQVDTPASRELHVATLNGIAAPDIKNQGDRRIYTWHSSFTKRPDDSGDENQKKKPKEPELSDVQVSTFSNWKQLGQWYADLQKPRAAVSDPVRVKADELVKGLSTRGDKAKAIYDYVSKNIRYVSLSFGLGRYQPHSAEEVLSNQYGDCKDKATLFEALLAAEHIESYPVLINSQHKIDPDIPSPAQFDHLINIVVLDGKTEWADTTPGVAPLGYLLPPLRDKQALAISPTAPAALQKTPMDPPFTPTDIITVDGQVDSFGRFQGKFSISDNAEFALIVRSALRVVPPNQWQQMADKLTQALLSNNAAKTTNPHFENVENLDQPLIFDAEFSEPNFLDLSRKDVDLAVPFASLNANDVDKPDKDSADPLKIGSIQDDKETWKIILPSQLTITLPVPIHVTRDYADYQSTYESNGATVTAERHLTVQKSQLAPSRYDDWEAFRDAILSDAHQKIDLANASPGNGSIPTGMSADDLFQAGVDAMNSRNYVEAAKLFTAVAQKDPDHDGLWNNLGFVYSSMQEYPDAITAFQHSIEKNPYDRYAHNSLGLAYQALGQYDDAIKEYLKQIEINPLDQRAHANLASLYLHQKKYDAAQKEYQTAIKITPNNYNLQIGLGTADLGLHQDNTALDAFHTALEKSPNPTTWNDVAYNLADNNSHLDLAEQYSENSIRAIEAHLNATSLDTVGPEQAGLVETISSFWDTMGWIKFKEGNLQAAESYVRSAWLLSDDATIGDHLGQIYEKEGRREDAIEAYALALTYPNAPVETRGRLLALVGEKNANAAIAFAHGDHRRSIDLPNAQKIDGVAQFWILLTPRSGSSEPTARTVNVEAKLISIDEDAEKRLQVSFGAKNATGKSKEDLTAALNDYTRSTLSTAEFPYSLPVGESGKILIRGTLTCVVGSESGCIFAPFPADQTWRLALSSSSNTAAQQ